MSRIHFNLPVAMYDHVLSWDQATVDRLLRHAYDVAMKVGLHLEEGEETDAYLREIEANGGTVDWDRCAVLPTEAQLDEVCELLRQNQPVRAAYDPVRGETTFRPVTVGNGGNLLFDWEQWTVKAPTVADLIWCCRWAQGNADVAALFAPFMLKDLNIVLEPMVSYAVMARYCRKQVLHAQPTEPLHVKYLENMAVIYEEHRGYRQPMPPFEWVNPPFRLGARAVRTMLARIDLGACDAMAIGPMTVSGMSAPVTVAGTTVVAVAEILAALNALHLIRPQAKLQAGCVSGEIDVATARVKYYSFRGHKQNMAIAEVLRRGIGVDVHPYVSYREANEPGLQACYEFGFAQAFWSGLSQRTCPEIGGLACGNMWSPEQAIMDIEITKEYNELLSGFDASDEAVAKDDIIAAGFEQGYHMTTDLMLERMHEHAAGSSFFRRGLPAGAEHDKARSQTVNLMREAREKSLAVHDEGLAAEPDTALSEALWACVEEAAAELGAAVPQRPWVD